MDFFLSIGFVSYLTSGVLFSFLLLLYFLSLYKGSISKQFLLLIIASIVWSLLLALSQVGTSIPLEMVMAADYLRSFTWLYVLQTAIGIYQGKDFWYAPLHPFSRRSLLLFFLISELSLLVNGQIFNGFGLSSPLLIPLIFLFSYSILGLVFIESLYRNTEKSKRPGIVYLCISAGGVFGYDFFVFSNALMVQNIDYTFWSLRGAVNAAIIAPLAIAAVRNKNLAPDLHVSRQFVFHSTTLVGAGLYLFMMSLAGFYIKETSGEWGKVLQILFLFSAVLVLALLFMSRKLKTRVQRYLNISFRNKYDYRIEWNRFSDTLLNSSEQPLYQRALKSIAQVLDAKGAALWLKGNQHYVCEATWGRYAEKHDPEPVDSWLVIYLLSNLKVVKIADVRGSRDYSSNRDHWFFADDSWLLVPLIVEDNLYGFVHLKKPLVNLKLDIEDLDLLGTVGHHIAITLFSKKVDEELQESQQFKRLNQMSAFLVHDLKTVLAQLSLTVENANQHKGNPEFIDDMIHTVSHATEKMNRLLVQLKDPEKESEAGEIDLKKLIESELGKYENRPIKPNLVYRLDYPAKIVAEEEGLKSALNHLIQNAVDAVNQEGHVDIVVSQDQSGMVKVEITDDGIGMSAEFIAEKLFKPFESTKGVSGMGVGVYQSRESIRALGGELAVESRRGAGTTFTIQLPISHG